MLKKEPHNIIYRPTHVEGPTFTRNGVISLQTGAIPSQGLGAFLVYADKRESIFQNFGKKTKNFFFGDLSWISYTRGHEANFEAVTFD